MTMTIYEADVMHEIAWTNYQKVRDLFRAGQCDNATFDKAQDDLTLARDTWEAAHDVEFDDNLDY